MKRLGIFVLILALGGTAISLASVIWGGSLGSEIAGGTPKQRSAVSADDRSLALAKTRRSCEMNDLDSFIEEQRRRTAAADADATSWRILAEAYLERALAYSLLLGVATAPAIYTKLPPKLRQDLDLGDAALARARELGDASSDSYRIEAALATGRITGAFSALRINGTVSSALEAAVRIDSSNPRVAVALACRKLFRPFGGDPAAACTELVAAAGALPLDERPLVLASMAALLSGQKDAALTHAEQAVERNAANPFAVEILRRLRAGEPDPFGRNLDGAK